MLERRLCPSLNLLTDFKELGIRRYELKKVKDLNGLCTVSSFCYRLVFIFMFTTRPTMKIFSFDSTILIE